MTKKEHKFPPFSKTLLLTAGILIVILLAIILLLHGNATSYQSELALVAQVYFDGEYSIDGGPWKEIVEGEHIPSSKGDVVLRGNFHLLTPDGEYVGIYNGEIPVAIYTNHISITVYQEENEPYVFDLENPIFDDSMCGVGWTAYNIVDESTEPIEMHIHNPHAFGNENAIDELLSSVSLWTGIEFEKDILAKGESQRNVGLWLLCVSIMFLGTALFSTLIHIKNSKIIWVLGTVILFAGAYMLYSAEGVSFWSESIVSNTTMLGSSMMLYMLFLSIALVHFMDVTKKIALVAVVTLGVANSLFFVLPVITDILFYDILTPWVIAQLIVNAVLFVCIVREFFVAKGKYRWLYFGLTFPIISFAVDVVATDIGIWTGGLVSAYVFIVLFIAAMFAVLQIIPHSINALDKAKQLETEKIVLNAQLAKSRISTMMSQIRPHFIYNTLGSIEQLCIIDPPKAGELVHNFAKYLRGNFGELDNPKPILMSQEMEHVQYYMSIENVRFPDMTFSFEMNSGDFHIPALTVQPIVENAVKHGLMKLPKGGNIKVVSYETDTHYCVCVEDDGVGFDTGLLSDERSHMGIRNIRERLKAMVDGALEIESTQGVGTKVLITIPKEARK